MGIVNVLKRKDASSVVVAIVVALVVSQLVSGVTVDLAQKITNLGGPEMPRFGGGQGWRGIYLLPVVTAALQLLALELLIWLNSAVRDFFSNKK